MDISGGNRCQFLRRHYRLAQYGNLPSYGRHPGRQRSRQFPRAATGLPATPAPGPDPGDGASELGWRALREAITGAKQHLKALLAG